MTAISKTEVYRSLYRAQLIPRYYLGILHAFFALSVLLGGASFAFSQLTEVSVKEWLTLPAIFLFGNWVEYSLHRWVLHRRLPGLKAVYRIHSLEHHRFFTEEHPTFDTVRDLHTVFFPVWAPVLAVALFFLCGLVLLEPIVSKNISLLFAGGSCLYFLMYEVFHFFHHVPEKYELKLLRSARERHLSHHYLPWMTTRYFNVTFPLFDWILGTGGPCHAFAGKTVLITGAASGIGRELALQLSQSGSNLILVDLQDVALQEVAASCFTKNAHQQKITLLPVTADVTNLKKMEELRDQLHSLGISPDIIIAAAGVGGLNPAPRFSIPLDQRMMAINYHGTVNTFAPFISTLLQKKSGTLIGISSLAGSRALPYAASYSASKAAQLALLESFRMDLRDDGIRVLTVQPGFVDTPMANHSQFKMPFRISAKRAATKILQAIADRKSVISFPWPMNWATTFSRLLPNFVYDRLMPRMGGIDRNVVPQAFSALKSFQTWNSGVDSG
ncbi:MAG: SDR family NAD(P)-dependent oxidoreductase [Bdellovibrionia bacterium]